MASILAAVSSLSDEKLVLAAIGEMKAVKTTRFDAGVLTAIETWIDSNPPSKILASVISLIPNLIPPQSLPESLAGRLVTMSEMKDSRVVANALDTLAHFSESTSERIQHTHWHADNRVAANALVLEGRASLTPKFIKTLRRQLKASNSARLASAIYALGEIAAHHKNRDLVYFSTQADLQDLLSDLPKWREHKDESVRRQAELALKKLGALDTPARSA